MKKAVQIIFALLLPLATCSVRATGYSYLKKQPYNSVALIRLENDLITHWRDYQHATKSDWGAFFKGDTF